MCSWFLAFFEKAFVSRVMRRLPILIFRFCRSDRVAGRNVLRVGVAFDAVLDRADALGGAVTPLALRRGAVHFDQHGVVDIGAESAFDHFQISFVTVTR